MAAVDTKKSNHRKLRFESLRELRAEIDRIVESDRAGTLTCTGNWTPGKTFAHIAAWVEYPYEGFPPEMKPPWLVRVIARMMKKAFVSKPMRPGFRIPKIDAGTFGTEEMGMEEGARKLRAAIDRLERREPAQFHSPALGPLTDDERIAITLRHAELHLGFLHPG